MKTHQKNNQYTNLPSQIIYLFILYMYLVHQYQPILESVTKLEKSYFILKTLSDYLINLYKHVNL